MVTWPNSGTVNSQLDGTAGSFGFTMGIRVGQNSPNMPATGTKKVCHSHFDNLCPACKLKPSCRLIISSGSHKIIIAPLHASVLLTLSF